MSKKNDIVCYNQEGTRSEQISVSDLPLFTIGKKKSKELSMLSLFSGCGGMDLGFEGGFICHRKSIPRNSKRIAKIINDDWVLLKRNRFTTVFANDILPEAIHTWIQYMSRFDKDPWIYRPKNIVGLNTTNLTMGLPATRICRQKKPGVYSKNFSVNQSGAYKVIGNAA